MLQACENEKWVFITLATFVGIVIGWYVIDKIKEYFNKK
tara:strand:+ start:161 stop:277 length:117 start_codon:yes stop_codon:yes gene_type:complete